MEASSRPRPTLFQAILPILILVSLLGLNVYVYGEDSSYGANQIALLLAAGVAAVIGFRLKITWREMRKGIVDSISSTMTAIIILLLIGALAGTWLISGIIPAMVYYGLQILNPTIFLFAACVISAVVSLGTGSSWSTIATIGIAMLGIGQALGISEGIIAGAVISGAYFGDKMSPLSDTTNLAPAMAGTDLFTHIRHMAWTTIPTISITLIIFLIIGFSYNDSVATGEIDTILGEIEQKFNITPLLFLVPVVVIVMIVKKVPPIPALLTGTLLGALFALIFQPNVILEVGSETKVVANVEGVDESAVLTWEDANGEPIESDDGYSISGLKPGSYTVSLSNDFGVTGKAEINIPQYGEPINDSEWLPVYQNEERIGKVRLETERSGFAVSAYKGIINAMSVETQLYSGNEQVDKLLKQKGMEGMLNTIWLILCAMIFGGIMETTRLLERITSALIRLVYNTGSLIGTTAFTCLFFNVTASDQYLSIVVPGRMYSKTYRDRRLKPENLSRTLEDSGTVTSVLVPWNTCGATQASVLGVATGTYMWYCFFNLLSPIVTVLYGIIGFKVPKMTEEEYLETETSSNGKEDHAIENTEN